MLPSTIDGQVRVESHAPRAVLFTINSPVSGWRVVRIIRHGADGTEEAVLRKGEVVPVWQWEIPEDVRTNEEFDRWFVLIDLELTDAQRLVVWTLYRTSELRLTRHLPPHETLAFLDLPVLYWSVQEDVSPKHT